MEMAHDRGTLGRVVSTDEVSSQPRPRRKVAVGNGCDPGFLDGPSRSTCIKGDKVRLLADAVSIVGGESNPVTLV